MQSLIRHSPLLLAFATLILFGKVDWGPAVRICGMTPPPQPTFIVLSPPLEKDNGFLRKIPVPLTKPGDMLGLEAEFFEVTAYAVGDDFTPRSITADGREVRPGITAACPESMPPGTPIYIEYLGVRICEDRGYLGDQRIDVAFPSVESALIFGRQRLAVVIIR